MFSTANINDEEPLNFDSPATALAVFLDLVAVQTPFIPDIDVPTTVGVLELSEKFECERISSVIKQRFKQVVKTDPWAIFILASKRNDLNLGREALFNMINGEHLPPGEGNKGLWNNVVQLEQSWQLGFMTCYLGKTSMVKLQMVGHHFDRVVYNPREMGLAQFFQPVDVVPST
jgi:hypothetical protein